jgi:hypothetical protein
MREPALTDAYVEESPNQPERKSVSAAAQRSQAYF